MSTPTLSWVVGSGGLLGKGVVSHLAGRGELWSPAEAVHWDSHGAVDQVAAAADEFVRQAGRRPWRVYWCAGVGVTSSSGSDLDGEQRLLEAIYGRLASHADPSCGSVFVASSAGGVYAGSPGHLFDEDVPAVPISPYGRAKIAVEGAARDFHRSSGIPVLVGRLSNLYGPEQNLAKPQGLISHLLRALLLRRPISIYVSTDSIRDYLFAPDAAHLIVDCMDRLESESRDLGPRSVTKVMASRNEPTIAFLVAEVARITKLRPLVVYGSSSHANFQARHLRLRSQVWEDLDRRAFTPLQVGMMKTYEALAAHHRAASLR